MPYFPRTKPTKLAPSCERPLEPQGKSENATTKQTRFQSLGVCIGPGANIRGGGGVVKRAGAVYDLSYFRIC